MLFIPKIVDYLKILTDEKVKKFSIADFDEYQNLQEKYCILN